MPLKFTLSWIKGAQTIEATSVKQLEEAAFSGWIACRFRRTLKTSMAQ
jgi:hypothetical protein